MLQITIYLSIYIIGIISCKKIMNIVIEDTFLEDQGSPISTAAVINIVSWIPIVNLAFAVVGVKDIIEEKYLAFKVKRRIKKKLKDIRDKHNGTETGDALTKVIDSL